MIILMLMIGMLVILITAAITVAITAARVERVEKEGKDQREDIILHQHNHHVTHVIRIPTV